ncbi:hypothetical protein Ddye_021951, partial [Dipteronia dyeriana]
EWHRPLVLFIYHRCLMILSQNSNGLKIILEGSGTSHLFNMMQGVNSMASCAFEPLLRDRSISNGEYNQAVREYKMTKSIVY